MKGYFGEPWQRYYPPCECAQKTVEVVRIQDSLRILIPVFRCRECGTVATCKPIRKGLLYPSAVSEAVIIERDRPLAVPIECEVCGDTPAQLHHWAPRALFGEYVADDWPMSWLCQPCHSHWHLVLNLHLASNPGR